MTMVGSWTLMLVIQVVCLDFTWVVNGESGSRVAANESSVNETFAYNATSDDSDCHGGDSNGNCTIEMTDTNWSNDANTNTNANGSIPGSPISIPISLPMNDTTTEASFITDSGKYPKNISDINVTDVGTTSSPTTEDSLLNFTLPTSVHSCDCDILKNECDINCCCDKECSPLDKQVFSYCVPVRWSAPAQFGSTVDSQHCYTSRFIYRNNTRLLETVEQRSSSDLFCIAVDNLSPKLVYKEFPLIKSVDEFNRMLRRFRKGIYNWTRHQYPSNTALEECSMNLNSSKISSSFKYGSCIFITTNGNSTAFLVFSLPAQSSSVSPLCDDSRPRPAFYLQDSSDDCLRRSPANQHECESTMALLNANQYTGFSVLASFRPYNGSFSIHDCPEDVCVKVGVSVDDGNITLKHPIYNWTSGTCMNVVTKVHYTVYHNGSEGITQMVVNLQLTNISLADGFFRQHFKISYLRTDTMTTLVRSGTPGYITGKPIISAKKVFKANNDLLEEIVLNNNSTSWLSIVKSTTGGFCDLSERINLLFLQNIQSECLLRVPSECSSFRNQTRHALLGDNAINMTDIREMNAYVSKYGDPNLSDMNKWVPVLTETSPQSDGKLLRCVDIFTSVHYKIIYSYTKNIRKPHAAIIGVLMTLTRPHGEGMPYEDGMTTVKMKSSVTFVDATRRAGVVTKFADPPVYEIKLPADFFYPFLSESVKPSPDTFILSSLFAITVFSM